MSLVVVPGDLGMLLGTQELNTERAAFLIGLAITECESILTPLPIGAKATVLTVAARAYTNPNGAQAQTLGPETVSFGGASPGIYLTQRDQLRLKQLAGGGGAFSVDTTPPCAMRNFVDPLDEPTLEDAEELLLDTALDE